MVHTLTPLMPLGYPVLMQHPRKGSIAYSINGKATSVGPAQKNSEKDR
ncbi:Uncharacterized protein {ECO:0000313/EMBL:ERM11920.1} [Pantoea ananatis]|jgi:hypothetical protein|nr:Uncharacterized protein {ECO:0000313/EMBL:ERM11920.1} [Pantoea ananatis]CRH33133.1 Uncharacterized protein BN1183_AQ_00550 [Pantoea ananatis]CRH37646.1 Uncharacterized protein {ECO:0000313/EMBL:ERM11920.1} [Pantoea ananatis]